VFSLFKTMADLLSAVLGCFQRLGRVPKAMVVDKDTSIIANGVGGWAVLHPGTYRFKARLRNTVNGATSGFSPVLSVRF
jgi:hypothetical protein